MPSTPLAESLGRHQCPHPYSPEETGWGGPYRGQGEAASGFNLEHRVAPGHLIVRRKGRPGGGKRVGSAIQGGGCFSRCLTQVPPVSQTEVLGSQNQNQEVSTPIHSPQPPTACRAAYGASERPRTERVRRHGAEREHQSHGDAVAPGTPWVTWYDRVYRLADTEVRRPRSRCWRGSAPSEGAWEKPPVSPS